MNVRKNDIIDRLTNKTALIKEREERLEAKKQREVRLEEEIAAAKAEVENYNLEHSEEEPQVFSEEEFMEKWNNDPDNKEIEVGDEIVLDIDDDFIIQE